MNKCTCSNCKKSNLKYPESPEYIKGHSWLSDFTYKYIILKKTPKQIFITVDTNETPRYLHGQVFKINRAEFEAFGEAKTGNEYFEVLTGLEMFGKQP